MDVHTSVLIKMKKKKLKIPKNVTVRVAYGLWSYYSPSENTITIARRAHTDSALEYLYIHEYGHAMLFQRWPALSNNLKRKFRRTFGGYTREDQNRYKHMFLDWIGLKPPAGFVTNYARTSAHEDWAETLCHFVLDGDGRVTDKTLARKIKCIKEILNVA